MITYTYADDIFSLGNELEEALHNKPSKRVPHLKAGISNSIPKSIAYHLLEPVMHLDDPMRIICREDNLTTLLSELAEHKLDIVISDRSMPDTPQVTPLTGARCTALFKMKWMWITGCWFCPAQ